MTFLKNLLAAILGCLIAFGIMFLMFILFASLLGSGKDDVAIKKNSILELQLTTPIKDYTGNNAADPFGGAFGISQSLAEVLHAIEVAKNDDDIRGISLNNNFIMAGLAQTQAIRGALEDFKEEGKFVYAYADFFMQKDYYLASVADSIFLNPVGGIDFKGLSSEVLFFKDFEEKTGVKMEVIRHGKYKSAVEPFIANEMSDANRTQIKELISSLWEDMIEDISVGRKRSRESLNVIADTLGGRTPEYAMASGLIDEVVFYDQYEDVMRSSLGLEEKDDLNLVALSDYVIRSNAKKINTGKDRIAVIYAQGEILYGEGSQDAIGQGIMTKAIRKAKDDEKVKAIVLRVDSPGGSALTSDIIWRELELAKEEKPFVVSMGNVAASGGYYIAAGANKIFAEPTTITGSIGVFGVIPNINELAAEIGINAEQVGTNENSVDYSLFEPMTDDFRSTVKEGIEDVYVWSGTDALELGLVDELGSLKEAIAEAAKLAELTEYKIKNYPKYKTGLELLMEDLQGVSAKAKQDFIKEEIGEEAYTALKQVKAALQQKGIQARMPYMLNIK